MRNVILKYELSQTLATMEHRHCAKARSLEQRNFGESCIHFSEPFCCFLVKITFVMARRSIKYTLIENGKKRKHLEDNRIIKNESCSVRSFLLKMAFIAFFLLILIYNMEMDGYNFELIATNNEVSSNKITGPETIPTNGSEAMKESEVSRQPFFVRTKNCMIPSVNPFTAGLLKIYNPPKPIACANDMALITSTYDLNAAHYILHINEDVAMKLLKSTAKGSENINCCYHEIIRPRNITNNADDQFKLLPCTNFHQDFQVPTNIDGIIVECKSSLTKRLLQKDAFSFIQYRRQNVTTDRRITEGKPSVLLIGIDSLSRINLRRTMPKTFAHLVKNQWFELEGYNKVGSNTFPNLMALLTGLDIDNSYEICKPYINEGLNKCGFIWNLYKDAGYYTAYAEDEASLATFNFLVKGFSQPPTDYYLRPFTLAIEKTLPKKMIYGLSYCVGRRQYSEYIYDYALEFGKRINSENESGFGLFWANSFSHDRFEEPAMMDAKVRDYFLEFERNKILDTSIVVFFSDHGTRWGPLVKLPEGFLENRLPMFFIWLPKWFQNKYPEFVKALTVNRHRLTSPYDIYMTLKHILLLNNGTRNNEKNERELWEPSKGCARCHSIFYELSSNRTCSDSGITDHWCTCQPYHTVSNSKKLQKIIAKLIIRELNHYLEDTNLTSICSKITLKSIESLYKRMDFIESNSVDGVYKIEFIIKQKLARFEATSRFNHLSQSVTVNVKNGISRLDSYKKTAKCILDKEAKKYCICKI